MRTPTGDTLMHRLILALILTTATLAHAGYYSIPRSPTFRAPTYRASPPPRPAAPKIKPPAAPRINPPEQRINPYSPAPVSTTPTWMPVWLWVLIASDDEKAKNPSADTAPQDKGKPR